MAVRRRTPSSGCTQPRKRPGLGDLLIPAGEEMIEQGEQLLRDIAYVSEEMEFRHSDTHLVETVETTTLDENGLSSETTVAVHPVN